MPLSFINPRTNSAARSAKKFSVMGLAREVLGLGVLGLKYHVLGLKIVVSDQSNRFFMNFQLPADIECNIYNS